VPINPPNPPRAAALLLGLSLVVAALSLAVAVVILLGPSPPSRPGTTTWYARHLTQAGIASWYGPRFHGRRTASGERFDQDKMTAAHRTLRFGTRVEVTHVKNGRSVEVRINDRGPYRRGRIIDVSRAAAAELGMKNAGLARVQIQPIHRVH
jgi:rare lipoprotein A (peptidoglycan hydrolase)